MPMLGSGLRIKHHELNDQPYNAVDNVEADSFIVTPEGELLLKIGDANVAAYAQGRWESIERQMT